MSVFRIALYQVSIIPGYLVSNQDSIILRLNPSSHFVSGFGVSLLNLVARRCRVPARAQHHQRLPGEAQSPETFALPQHCSAADLQVQSLFVVQSSQKIAPNCFLNGPTTASIFVFSIKYYKFYNNGLFFVLFRSFSHSSIKYISNFNIVNRKSVDGVLGIRTRDRRRVGADETTPPST